MQDFKFNSYTEFYEYLTEEHQVMVNILKGLIQDNIPDIKEKLSWNVPFFYKEQNICYIWPGSVPWGKKTHEGVTLGFTKGYLLPPNNLLEKENRKLIRAKSFCSTEEIKNNVETIVQLLRSAEKLDK